MTYAHFIFQFMLAGVFLVGIIAALVAIADWFPKNTWGK